MTPMIAGIRPMAVNITEMMKMAPMVKHMATILSFTKLRSSCSP